VFTDSLSPILAIITTLIVSSSLSSAVNSMLKQRKNGFISQENIDNFKQEHMSHEKKSEV
jgi:hypothetical protein